MRRSAHMMIIVMIMDIKVLLVLFPVIELHAIRIEDGNARSFMS